MDMHTFLEKLPKVELHCHLEGTITAQTFAQLATKHGMPLHSYQDPAELFAFDKFGLPLRSESSDKPSGSLVEFYLTGYSQISQSVRDVEDFSRVTYETLADAARSGVRYIEMFWSPAEHLNVGVPYPVQVEGLAKGIRAAEVDHGVQCRMIAGINRDEGPAKGVELVQHMIEHPSEYVIGIGLDYDEEGHPPEAFWKAFRLAKQAGLHCTSHACEWARPPHDVETCLDLLACERIDHGYRVLFDTQITKRCADEGIVFTVIPLTAVFPLQNPQDWVAHGFTPGVPAIKLMVERGLRIMLNSDDPGMLNFSRIQNYYVAADVVGFKGADFKQFSLNGIAGSWLDDSTKRRWTKEWSDQIDGLLSQLETQPAL
jgi:adenosine deaminase